MHHSVRRTSAQAAPEGEALADRMAAFGDRPWPTIEILRIGREVALGLAAAHQQGRIHGRVEPANIWLETTTDRAELLNFGPSPAGKDQQRAEVGMSFVASSYISPEQARGAAVGHLSDLFSLGSVLYHIATGRRPFRGGNAVGTLLAVATIEPAAPSTVNADLPAALNHLIRDLMAKRPDDRPASAQQVVERLRAIERAQPLVESQGDLNRPPRTKFWGRRVSSTRR